MKQKMKMLRVMAVFTGLALTVTGCGSQEKTPEKDSGEEHN